MLFLFLLFFLFAKVYFFTKQFASFVGVMFVFLWENDFGGTGIGIGIGTGIGGLPGAPRFNSFFALLPLGAFQ